MSRSFGVALGAWAAMLAATGVVIAPRWPQLMTLPHDKLALALGVAVLGATMAAAAISRIVDPRRETPILVWGPFALGLLVIAVVGASHSSGTEDVISSTDDVSSSSSSSHERSKGMGLFWAIAATLLCLGIYGAGLYLITDFARPVVDLAGPTPPPAPDPGSPTNPTEQPPPAPDILAARDLATATTQAIAAGDPRMAADLLARYLAAKATWKDLLVRGSAVKPGKRMCVGGVVERSEPRTLEDTAVLATHVAAKKLEIDAIVVGASAAARGKRVKLCGVVTGVVDKVAIVAGMFEK